MSGWDITVVCHSDEDCICRDKKTSTCKQHHLELEVNIVDFKFYCTVVKEKRKNPNREDRYSTKNENNL